MIFIIHENCIKFELHFTLSVPKLIRHEYNIIKFEKNDFLLLSYNLIKAQMKRSIWYNISVEGGTIENISVIKKSFFLLF